MGSPLHSTPPSGVPRVLIADESPFVCRLIAGYLEEAGGFEIGGVVHDAGTLVSEVQARRPDVVTMGLELGGAGGLEALRQVMSRTPVPVVVVTGATGRAATRTMQALDLGAVDFALKYTPEAPVDPDVLEREIVAKVRRAAQVKVIRLVESHGAGRTAQAAAPPPPVRRPAQRLVVIGASTGGPEAVRSLLAELPASLSAAILIVQHLPASFTGVLAAQLNRSAPLPAWESEDGQTLAAGKAYVAPGGMHLIIRPPGRALVQAGPPVRGHCPSIDVAMESAATVFGRSAVGVLLTGMGDDGALGLQAIRAAGGLTYAQSAASCVVNGMPQSAVDLGAASHLGTPSEIGRQLARQLAAEEASV